jgi:hypothetical protein
MAVNVEKMLDGLSSTLIGAFGDKVIIGVLVRLLDDITPGIAYKAVSNNTPLFINVSNQDWDRWKIKAQKFRIKDFSVDRVVSEITKYRPDLIGIIINTNGGIEWLNDQIVFAKDKLGI